MPSKETTERAKRDKRQGKSPTTQAGEYVREEMHHVREGKHGARSAKQVIAIGLSKARRAGVDLPPPKKGKVSEKTRKSAKRAWEARTRRAAQAQTVRQAVAGDPSRLGTRGIVGRFAPSLVAADPRGRAASHRRRAFRRREKGGPHQGPCKTRAGRPQGRENPRRSCARRALKPALHYDIDSFAVLGFDVRRRSPFRCAKLNRIRRIPYRRKCSRRGHCRTGV